MLGQQASQKRRATLISANTRKAEMLRTHAIVQRNIDDAITSRDLACADEPRWSIKAFTVLLSSGITTAINPDHHRRAVVFSLLLKHLLRAVDIKE